MIGIDQFFETGCRFFRALKDNQRGVIFMEFALAAPVVALLFIAGFETARYVLAHQKVSHIASSVADLVAQSDAGITEGTINDLMLSSQFIASPFPFAENGSVIISAVAGTTSDGNTIMWQRCGGGDLEAKSSLGSPGDENVKLASDIELGPNAMAIVSEALYVYRPLFFNQFIGQQTLRHESLFRPRLGLLSTVHDDGAPSSICT
ncbi:MAG: TadE/TadG family type IV pilus assembly protein [Pseudomonadota bacterium]